MNRRFCRTALAICILGLSSTISPGDAAETQTLWSIGTPDGSGREFRLFGNHEALGAALLEGITYQIGKDQPKDWPYIHPGPLDQWAWSLLHPFRIEFTLDKVPEGVCVLVVDVVAAHRFAPPWLLTRINDWETRVLLPRGPGDGVLSDEALARPSAQRIEFSSSLLHPGLNTITLTAVDGSWFLYDAIRLESEPGRPVPPPRLASLRPTGRLVEENGHLEQVLLLGVENLAKNADVVLAIAYNGGKESQAASIPFGRSEIPVMVPEDIGNDAGASPGGDRATVSVHLGAGDTLSSRTVAVPRARHWVVYICPSVHTDIGYTDHQPQTIQRHRENIGRVIEMCRKNPDLRWNAEVAWKLENYLDNQTPEKTEALIELLKSGRIGLTATYLNELTALMGDEDMNRIAYYAADLGGRYGIDHNAALLTDVPSATWGLVSTLADSGVRYFAEGCNQTRGPMAGHSNIREPFYWEGPDGSRVLAWFSLSGYAQSHWFASVRTLDDLGRHLENALREFENSSYPYDTVQLYGAFGDNQAIDAAYGNLVAQWNGTYAYPKLKLALVEDYFRAIEKEHGPEIPVKRGDCGAFWEDGAGSTAHETAIHRDNQQRILAAETLWSLAGLSGAPEPYPFEQFEAAWKDILFYDEHTWGAAESVIRPESPRTIEQWKFKSAFATRPEKEIGALLDEGLAAYVRRVPASRGELVVVNTLSWPRSGPVELPFEFADAVKPCRIGDNEEQAVPVQRVEDRWVAWVQDVPGFGTKVLCNREPSGAGKGDERMNNGEEMTQAAAGSAQILSNDYYTIRLEPRRGVTEIVDRESKKDILDAASPYAFGQIVYVSGGGKTRLYDCNPTLPLPVFKAAGAGDNPLAPPEGTALVSPATIHEIGEVVEGPLFSEVIVRSSAPSMPRIQTRLRLWNQEKRISIEVRIHSKKEIHEKEGVYVAFPFRAKTPRFRLGLTNSVADPKRDFLPGACHDWYCVQSFVVAALDGGREVVWTPVDTPLITMGDFNHGRWASEADYTTATLFSYAMNNYWWTNYKAGQGGDFRFRYELTSRAEGETDGDAERFGREARTPLMAGLSPGVEKAAATGLTDFAIEGNAVAVTLKRAQNGDGTILRLRNVDNFPAEVSLSSSHFDPKLLGGDMLFAERNNRVENYLELIPAKDGRAGLTLSPQQTATIRLTKQRSEVRVPDVKLSESE